MEQFKNIKIKGYSSFYNRNNKLLYLMKENNDNGDCLIFGNDNGKLTFRAVNDDLKPIEDKRLEKVEAHKGIFYYILPDKYLSINEDTIKKIVKLY